MKGKKFHRRRIYFFLFASCQRKKHPNSSIRYLNTDATRHGTFASMKKYSSTLSIKASKRNHMATCSVNWLEHFNAPPSLAFRQGWNTFGGRGSKNGRVTLSRLDERGHDAFLKVAWRSRVPWSTTLSRDTFYLNKRTLPPFPGLKKRGRNLLSLYARLEWRHSSESFPWRRRF